MITLAGMHYEIIMNTAWFTSFAIGTAGLVINIIPRIVNIEL